MLRKLARKWWFWVGLSGCLLVVLVVGGVYAEWKITRARGEARRDEAVRKLDAESPGWRAADLCARRNATLPPKDRNAAERALEAAKLVPASFEKSKHEERWWADLKVGVLPHSEDVCESARLYQDCGEAIAVARSVRHLISGGFRLLFAEPDPLQTLLPEDTKMRSAGALLEYDAAVLATAGRTDEAVESCHAILNCGRGIGDEPSLISQLVRMGQVMLANSALERVLGLGEPATGLAELQSEFAAELSVSRLTYGLRGERAMMFKLIQNIDDGIIPAKDVANVLEQAVGREGVSPVLLSRLVLYRKHLPGQQAALINLYDKMIEADRLPAPERIATFDRICPPSRNFENIMGLLLLPTYTKVAEADNRTRVACATSVAALACERYRRQYGRWPESLAAIPRDILPQVPEDPYTGRPLAYRLTDDGAVVYAVGSNGVDDGGVTLDSTGKPGTDIGFRLFDPQHRRRLPTPRIPERLETDHLPFSDEPPPETEP